MEINIEIFSQRIREARELRGLSITELAEKLGLTKQTVSAYETQKIKPSDKVLFSLSQELNLPPLFFTKPRKRDNYRITQLNFRKLSSASNKILNQATQIENLLSDIYSFLTQYIDLPHTNIPDFGKIDFQKITREEIENIASKTRKYWGLGDGPISNVIRLLENNGILVTKVNIADKVDAFSCWRNNLGIIILSKDKPTAVRLRFDAAHELGHLILHKSVQDHVYSDNTLHKLIEDQAHFFASCFLMPRETFTAEILNKTVPGLLMVKKRWKVSVQAMIMRLFDLGEISDYQKSYLFKKLGSRISEIYDNEIEHENPVLLNKAFKVLMENEIPKEEITNDLNLNVEDIIEIANLDSGTFKEKDKISNIIRFKLPAGHKELK